ncbi:MAG: GAF domain-containing protein [Anaerolineae bacterium]|nr:GAF domain-containing protein [Anaerolineae bacterium]
MIARLRRNLLQVRHVYLNPVDRQRANVLLIINFAIVVASAIWGLTGVLPRFLSGTADLLTAIVLLVILILGGLIFQLIQTGRLRGATWLFVLMLTGAVAQIVLFWSTIGPTISGTFIAISILPIVAGGVLLNRRGVLIVSSVIIIVLLIGALNQIQLAPEVTFNLGNDAPFDFGIILITIGIVLTFLLAFSGNLERLAKESFSDVQQRQWITEFGITISRQKEENSILAQALNLIRERMQYLSSQVYLIDEEGRLSRSYRAGMTQETSIQAGLKPGDASIITEALRNRQPAVTSTEDSSAPRRAHLLTAANYAVAVPIMYNSDVIGVLDVQSSAQNPFSQNEIAALLLLADQIGVGLHYAHTIGDLERALREQETTSNRLQSQVQEFRQRERRGFTGAWNSYIGARGKYAIGFDLEADDAATLVAASDLPEPIQATLQQGKMHIETVGEEQIVNVPIIFRDQTLGAMSFSLPLGQNLTERQIEMAQTVSERLALALENARLFEQSQAQATRERKANEVGSRLIGATDVNAVLNIAALNFNEALGAIHTQIFIQPDVLVEPLAQTVKEERR